MSRSVPKLSVRLAPNALLPPYEGLSLLPP
jgi:hypothetical protein